MAYNSKTSYFKIEQKEGRWRFIDPNGNPFFSSGICDLKAEGFFSPDLGYSPYHRNIIELYGDNETWASVTYDRLVAWGFTTIGAWSGNNIKNTRLPYAAYLGLSERGIKEPFVEDYFSEEWIKKVDDICKEKVAPLSSDINLIGYYLANELRWGPDLSKFRDLFADFCSMPSNSRGKAFLVNFLHNRYNGDISNFNHAWRTSYKSYDELYNVTSLGNFSWTTKAKKDRAKFTYLVAEQFFKICYETIKRYDNNHLLLGVRFLSYATPKEVIEACSNYIDVITINHYPVRSFIASASSILRILFNFVLTAKSFQEYYDISNKPIMITEINFRARDSGLPNTQPSPFLHPVSLTQNKRADRFYSFMLQFVEKPYSVGYHWYSYMDDPYTGRTDGENSNIGIVNAKDEPYTPLVNRMIEINHMAQEYVNQ
jgi:agarase